MPPWQWVGTEQYSQIGFVSATLMVKVCSVEEKPEKKPPGLKAQGLLKPSPSTTL
jgi:hypothetical protein